MKAWNLPQNAMLREFCQKFKLAPNYGFTGKGDDGESFLQCMADFEPVAKLAAMKEKHKIDEASKEKDCLFHGGKTYPDPTDT